MAPESITPVHPRDAGGEATRAIVLARGLGTRMRVPGGDDLTPAQSAAAAAGLKAMIPVGERPFLDHVLHHLAEAGVTRVALVLGPEHEPIREYYRRLKATRLGIEFVTQLEAKGTADAMLAAEQWVQADPFLVLNADNLYPVAVLARLVAARGPAVPGFRPATLGLPASRFGAFALIERDAAGCLSRIVEKPGEAAIVAAGAEALISMNVWRFDGRIFQACRDVPASARGEFELPEAVGLAAARGVCFEVFNAEGPVLDLSSRSDVAGVARQLREAAVVL